MSPTFRRARLSENPQRWVVGTGALVAVGALLMPAFPANAAGAPAYRTEGVLTGLYQQTIPFWGSVSSTVVAKAGDAVTYRVAVPYGARGVGWMFPTDAFRLILDLSALADDVEDIDEVFDEMSTTPIANLTVTRTGSQVTFEGLFDPMFDEFVVEFAPEFARGGDSSMGVSASLVTRGQEEFSPDRWDYGPGGSLFLPVTAAQPAMDIMKQPSRTTVAPGDDSVTYTVTVTPTDEGPGNGPFTVTDDLSDVLAESGASISPADITILSGVLGAPVTVEDGILTVNGTFGSDASFVLSYTIAHEGLGDQVMKNSACVQSAGVSAQVQSDPAVPVPLTYDTAAFTIVELEGARVCGDAADVVLKAATTSPPVVSPPAPGGEVASPSTTPTPDSEATLPAPTDSAEATPVATPTPSGSPEGGEPSTDADPEDAPARAISAPVESASLADTGTPPLAAPISFGMILLALGTVLVGRVRSRRGSMLRR